MGLLFSSMTTSKTEQIWTSRFDQVETVVHQTIPQFIWSAPGAETWEDLVAFECAWTCRKFTHAEVRRCSRSFGASLLRSGLKGEEGNDGVIAIMMPNCPEYPVVFLGILEAGFVASLVSTSSTAFELASQLCKVRAKAVVAWGKLGNVVSEAVRSLDWSCSIIFVGDGHDDHPVAAGGDFLFSEMIRTNPENAKICQSASFFDAREKVALVPFSSGTTGPPKGVMLTHSNIATNMLQFTHPKLRTLRSYVEARDQEVILGILPFSHIFALNGVMLQTLYLGARCVTLPKFEPESFVKAMKTFKLTFAPLVTPLLNFIASCPHLTREDLAKLHTIQTGAAPVGSALISAFYQKFGESCKLSDGFGMTEMSPVSHLTPPMGGPAGSIGLLLPSTQAKLVDTETGELLGANKVGELCVKGPQVMKGYFEDETATKAAFDADGYLRTGDLASVDDQGYFYIVDRLKELIKVKGLQVAPFELENLIRQVPGVADCAVIGIPHEKYGEVPRAYIVQKKGEIVTEEEIGRFLRERVAKHKLLEGGTAFVKSIPKAPSGKILRRELKKAYMEQIANQNGLNSNSKEDEAIWRLR